MDDSRRQFALMAAREPIPLARGALLIAREEYPDLDIDHYVDCLGRFADQAQARIDAGASTIERLQELSEFLFGELGFAGNREQFGDPRNSFLNCVLERRLGIPISLSVVYVEVGRRLGLNLQGVSFPGHFLVKAVDQIGELIIDPFNNGVLLSLEDIAARLSQVHGKDVALHPSMLKSVGARHILARMLRNLKNIYVAGADWKRALAALDRILLLEPRALDELLERAKLYEMLECFGPAIHDLNSFLRLAPDHSVAEAVREHLVHLVRQVARIN